MLKKTPEDAVADFLSTTKQNRGGAPCSTCRLPRASDLARAIEAYARLRGDPPEGTTTPTFGFLVKKHLAPTYGCSSDRRSILRHAVKCLGIAHPRLEDVDE